MQPRTYRAKSMKDALTRVRRDLDRLLLGHGELDHVLHAAAAPELSRSCRRLRSEGSSP